MKAPMHGLEHELRQHAGALRALALRLVGPSHADDLVQETSLLACTQRPDERSGLGGWLRKVLRHRAGKLQRGDARRTRREGAVARNDAAPSPLDVAAQREVMAALHEALMALPAPYQGVLLQRFFQDLSPTAIAANNGVALATVKSQLQRGLGLLRERLDADGRCDWRGAFAGAFGLPSTTAPVVAATAGAMLMSTKTLWLGGTLAAALLCVALWPDAGAPSPTSGSAREPLAVASAAGAREATSEPMQRTEVLAAAAPDAPAAAPMRIRLVDAFDGAPLRGFYVNLEGRRSPGKHTIAVSNDRGELTIGGAWRDQAVDVIAIDDGRVQNPQPTQSHTIGANEWPADDRCLDVPFAVGPTYTLVFDAPPPEGLLAATLVAADDAAEVHDRVVFVRPGTPPWIRFSVENTNPSDLGDGPCTLVVCAELWRATGPVERVRGTQATPVLLRSQHFGALRVEATVESRPPRPDDRAHVSVYAVDDAGQATGTDRTKAFSDGASIAHFELPVGRYRVFVGGPDEQTHREDVTIRAAQSTEVRADFPAGSQRFTLQVVLRSETGTRAVDAGLRARQVGGTDLVSAPWKERRSDGANVYELHGLRPGEWEVTLGPTPHLPPWDTATKRVRADAGSVEFVCLDAGAPPPGHGRFRVVDAATKQPIEGAGVTTLLDDPQCVMQYFAGSDRDGIASLGPCLAGSPAHVLVRAAGHAPVWFPFTPLDVPDPEPQGVELGAGWGTLLIVVQQDARTHHGRPLPGVRVLADGVPAGTTDARGLVLVSTSARPRRIELLHDELEIVQGGEDATTLSPASDARHPFFVVMGKKGSTK